MPWCLMSKTAIPSDRSNVSVGTFAEPLIVVVPSSTVITEAGVAVGVGSGGAVGDGVGVEKSAVKMMSNCLRSPPLSNGMVVRAACPLM